MKRRFVVNIMGVIALVTGSLIVNASEFNLPKQFPAVLGAWQQVEVKAGDTVSALAFDNGISTLSLLKHNPRLKTAKYLHPKEHVLIPSCFYAPVAVTPGQIVVNVATQTLFYRPTTNQSKLWVFPVTVGTEKHPTPIGEFYITKKKENPVWYPPASVRAASAKRGVQLPFGIEGGKGNPLGAYAMYLNKPTYLIHTAAGASKLGGKNSYGCVRMYERDISKLYPIIPVQTKVKIIDQPISNKAQLHQYCARNIKQS